MPTFSFTIRKGRVLGLDMSLLLKVKHAGDGFWRKLENHAAATALNYFAYNFIQIHRTLRTPPAMAAGIDARLRSVEALVLWESYEARRAETAA